MTLPAETGPVLAPDRLSVWPVEGGRYGLDATYHGMSGFERAEAQRQRLQASNLRASVGQHWAAASLSAPCGLRYEHVQ
jgi:hypothetical protein